MILRTLRTVLLFVALFCLALSIALHVMGCGGAPFSAAIAGDVVDAGDVDGAHVGAAEGHDVAPPVDAGVLWDATSETAADVGPELDAWTDVDASADAPAPAHPWCIQNNGGACTGAYGLTFSCGTGSWCCSAPNACTDSTTALCSSGGCGASSKRTTCQTGFGPLCCAQGCP